MKCVYLVIKIFSFYIISSQKYVLINSDTLKSIRLGVSCILQNQGTRVFNYAMVPWSSVMLSAYIERLILIQPFVKLVDPVEDGVKGTANQTGLHLGFFVVSQHSMDERNHLQHAFHPPILCYMVMRITYPWHSKGETRFQNYQYNYGDLMQKVKWQLISFLAFSHQNMTTI